MRPSITLSVATLSALLALPTLAAAGESMSQAFGQVGSMMKGSNLGQDEIVTALRQALAQGTTHAIEQLGQSDGFWKDPSVKIPVPSFIGRFEGEVRVMGYGKTLDEFQLTLNRAAEQAVPKAASIIGNAISKMSVGDAKAILNGPNDAATEYFKRTSSTELAASIQPIVAQATAQVGVTEQYKKLTDKAGPLMKVSGGSSPIDLDAYVTQKAMDGVFIKIAAEEARIRNDPGARSTDVMKKVFAAEK